MSLEWITSEIAPQSQKNLELSWTPQKVVSCREILQISDLHGNRKDVAIVLKSCPLPKTSTRKASTGYVKTLKLKTPSPPHFVRAVPAVKVSAPASRESQTAPATLSASPLRNTTNLQKLDFLDALNFTKSSPRNFNKENSSPSTPRNASALFDNIRFTPLTETKQKCESKLEYLASLPTPVGIKRDDIVTSTCKIAIRRNLLESVMSPEVHERLSEQPTPTPSRCQKQTESTFSTDEIDEIEIILSEGKSLLSNTRVMSAAAPLCVISEEEQLVIHTEFHKTFEVNKSRSLDDLSENDAHRIASESMGEIKVDSRDSSAKKLRLNQGSMPNLNDINSAVGSIEQNRYFRKQQSEIRPQDMSMESLASTDFRDIEGCAQSSRYFNDDLMSPVRPSSAELDNGTKEKGGPSKRRSKSAQTSPTVRRFQEEPEFRSPSNKRYQQMTFSPPTRNKLFDEVNYNSSGRTIRATTWKQSQNQQIFAVPRAPREQNLRLRVSQSLHSLSSSSVASGASTSSTPVVGGRLYNENYLNAYTRKDPFSATTTNDPFLSSTMYLDEQTLDGIEKTYKKWLNALVTIPEDLESDRNEKIDVGKVFNEAQSKEVIIDNPLEVNFIFYVRVLCFVADAGADERICLLEVLPVAIGYSAKHRRSLLPQCSPRHTTQQADGQHQREEQTGHQGRAKHSPGPGAAAEPS